MDVLIQTQAEAGRKSLGCVGCHSDTDQPTMHTSKNVQVGCVDCHGGSPEVMLPPGVVRGTGAYDDVLHKAHVQPRFPDAWAGADGKYSSANPQRSYTLLNEKIRPFLTLHQSRRSPRRAPGLRCIRAKSRRWSAVR